VRDRNAENVLRISSVGLADQYAGYIDALAQRYAATADSG